MSIKLLVGGGLGNQLFQYAAARAVAAHHRTTLTLDTRFFSLAGQDLTKSFLLDQFPIRADVVKYPKGDAHSMTRRLGRIFSEPQHRVFREPGLGYHPAILDVQDGCTLVGTFQSARYFDGIADIVRDELSFEAFLAARDIEIAQDLSGYASIHVRRGDYQNLSGFQMRDPEAYYERAIRYLRDACAGIRFIVFSDDLDWCRSQSIFNGCEFFSSSSPWAAVDILAMSRCSHHIIANSSFSWWGAWWSRSPDKIVVAPQYWFGDLRSRDISIVPDSWVVM